jgi:hypothetical protein
VSFDRDFSDNSASVEPPIEEHAVAARESPAIRTDPHFAPKSRLETDRRQIRSGANQAATLSDPLGQLQSAISPVVTVPTLA